MFFKAYRVFENLEHILRYPFNERRERWCIVSRGLKMIFVVLGVTFVVVGGLSVMKWYISPRWQDVWMDGKWHMGD